MPAVRRSTQRKYTCEYCSQSFDSQRGYNLHVSNKDECSGQHKSTIAGAEAQGGNMDADEVEVENRNYAHEDTWDDGDDIRMETADVPGSDEREATEEPELPTYERIRGTESFVEHFPVETAGAPIRPATEQERSQLRQSHEDVGPFSNPEVFDVAELLVTSGMSGKKRTKLMKLERFQGACPWNNNREMIADIDKHLPRGSKWSIDTIKAVGGNGCEYGRLWFRNTLTGVTKFCENPTFKDVMQWKPTREWTTPDREVRKHGETMASNRMWDLQKIHPDKHATLIPTFFASDETALTAYVGEQKAYCVYMTIGNIPKHVRRQLSKRAMILVGYIPVMSLECEPDLEKRALLKRQIFHECMRKITAPLIEAGRCGAEVACSDGFVRRIYPIFSGGMIDFPEQCKYACTRQPYCPTCEVPPDKRGDLTDHPLRDRIRTLEAIEQHRREGSAVFEKIGLMDVKPFWSDLPWVDAGLLCLPDLLHQLYKGVFGHLVKWIAHVEGAKEFDNRYMAMSPHHGLRHFKKGITKISRWTGREAKEQCKSFLPVVADQDPEVMSCARALVRFMYLAHSSELTDHDLAEMTECLEEFHDNKEIFRLLGALGEQDPKKKKGPVRTFHMVAKLHALQHYVHYIRELGTPDGFNTELPERLHIPSAKHGFNASNKKEVIKQMATYVQRIEALATHRAYLDDQNLVGDPLDDDPGDEDGDYDGDDVNLEGLNELVFNAEGELDNEDDSGDEDGLEDDLEDEEVRGAVAEIELEADDDEDLETTLERRDVDNGTWAEEYQIDDETGQQESPSVFYPEPSVKHSKKPTLTATATHLITKHGASKLFPAIKSFLGRRNLNLSANDKYRVWSRCRLIHGPPPFKPAEGEKTDVIRAFPMVIGDHGQPRNEAQYDTALFVHDEEEDGIHRYRACRVRAIFELPDHLRHLCDKKLVYAELFNPFHSSFDVRTHLYKTTSSTAPDGQRLAIVMPLSDIKLTAHIAPHYGNATADLNLAREKDILSSCRSVSIKGRPALSFAPTNIAQLCHMLSMADMDVNAMAKICANFIIEYFSGTNGLPATSRLVEAPTLVRFITCALEHACLHPSVVFYALRLLMRIKDRHPGCQCGSGDRLFLTVLIIAAKYTRDDARKNNSWCRIGSKLFYPREINQMEREMCSYLGWLLNINPDELCVFEDRVRSKFGNSPISAEPSKQHNDYASEPIMTPHSPSHSRPTLSTSPTPPYPSPVPPLAPPPTPTSPSPQPSRPAGDLFFTPHITQRLNLLGNVHPNSGILPGPQGIHPTAYAGGGPMNPMHTPVGPPPLTGGPTNGLAPCPPCPDSRGPDAMGVSTRELPAPGLNTPHARGASPPFHTPTLVQLDEGSGCGSSTRLPQIAPVDIDRAPPPPSSLFCSQSQGPNQLPPPPAIAAGASYPDPDHCTRSPSPRLPPPGNYSSRPGPNSIGPSSGYPGGYPNDDAWDRERSGREREARDREPSCDSCGGRQRQPSVTDRVKVEILNQPPPASNRFFPNQVGPSSPVASRYDPRHSPPLTERQPAKGRSPYLAAPSQNAPYPGYWERERGAPPKAPSRQHSPALREPDGLAPGGSCRYDPRMDIDQEPPRCGDYWQEDQAHPSSHPLDRERYSATPDGTRRNRGPKVPTNGLESPIPEGWRVQPEPATKTAPLPGSHRLSSLLHEAQHKAFTPAVTCLLPVSASRPSPFFGCLSSLLPLHVSLPQAIRNNRSPPSSFARQGPEWLCNKTPLSLKHRLDDEGSGPLEKRHRVNVCALKCWSSESRVALLVTNGA